MEISDIYLKYSDIVFIAPNRVPTQLVINLKEYLDRTFPHSDLFIQDFQGLGDIRAALKNKYGNNTTCFKEHGRHDDIPLDKLKYYQSDVGISGPMNNEIDDPVHVINYNGLDILFNGYHRTFYHLVRGQLIIKGYYLTL